MSTVFVVNCTLEVFSIVFLHIFYCGIMSGHSTVLVSLLEKMAARIKTCGDRLQERRRNAVYLSYDVFHNNMELLCMRVNTSLNLSP